MEMVNEFIEVNKLYIFGAALGLAFALLIVVIAYFYTSNTKTEIHPSEKLDNLSTLATRDDDSSTIDMVISEVDEEPRMIKHNFGTYQIYEIKDILTHEECDELIAQASAKGMSDSAVLSYGTDSITEMDTNHRKSKHGWFADNSGPVFQKIAAFTQISTMLPIENQEMLQISSYEKDGKFNAHFDACVYEDKAYCDKINNNAGQRKMTLLIYLNDNFEGGETEFVNLNFMMKPKKGNGILFENTDDNQNIYEESKHQGNTVKNGEKWIATKWVHFGKFA